MRITRTRLMRLALAAAAVVGLAAPAAASARAPRTFYGVMTAQDPSTAELARMGTGNVGIVRINLAWSGVQASPNGPYNWDRYDTEIGDAARAGVQVL